MARIKIPDGPAEELHRLWMMCPELTAPGVGVQRGGVQQEQALGAAAGAAADEDCPDQPLRGFDWTPGLRRWRNMI